VGYEQKFAFDDGRQLRGDDSLSGSGCQYE